MPFSKRGVPTSAFTEQVCALPCSDRMEWFNISYNDPRVRSKVDARCGPPLTFWPSLRAGGTGSPRLILVEAPDALLALIDRVEDRRFAHAEVRSNGLLVRLRQRLETIGVPVPWSILKENNLTPGANGGYPRWEVLLQDGTALHFTVHPSNAGALQRWCSKVEGFRVR